MLNFDVGNNMENKLEELVIIKDEMLMDPSVDASLVLKAYRIAEEDKYLYELLIDWMKVVDPYIKNMLRDEVFNYTEEVIRAQKIRNQV